MPLYEYFCPQCLNKFETMKAMVQRHRARCPHCNSESKLVPSRCSWHWFNAMFVDGGGFSSKYMKKEAIAELDAECRER